jgi:hypothetical protein
MRRPIVGLLILLIVTSNHARAESNGARAGCAPITPPDAAGYFMTSLLLHNFVEEHGAKLDAPRPDRAFSKIRAYQDPKHPGRCLRLTADETKQVFAYEDRAMVFIGEHKLKDAFVDRLQATIFEKLPAESQRVEAAQLMKEVYASYVQFFDYLQKQTGNSSGTK